MTAALRVLHVVNSGRRRGAEIFASDLIRYLARHRVSQHVAVLDPGDQTLTFDASVTGLRGTGHSIPGLGVDIGRLRDLRRLIGGWKPDVIQGHGGDSIKYLSLAALGSRTPIVHRSIGTAPPLVTKGLRNSAYRRLMQRARVVAVAGVLAREAVEVFGVRAERVHSIPNAVDPDRITPSAPREDVRRRLGISPADKVILSAGALCWEKNPLAHLRVSTSVMQQDARTRHVFAGEGPLHDELSAEARRMGVADRVALLGARDDMGDLFLAADVLLLVSRMGTEGLPAVVIEAGMAGLPVAGYAIAGIDEVVLSGRTGILVEAGSEQELADEIVRLFANPQLSSVLGREASRHCRESFDIARIGPRYLKLYAGSQN